MEKTTTTNSGGLIETYKIPTLPPDVDLETKPVLRALKEAHKHLAELKGRACTIPNQGILIDTLTLQEAAASSEIENIVTTQDELYQMNSKFGYYPSAEAKEVDSYGAALSLGFTLLAEKQGVITTNTIIALFQTLKRTTGEIRTNPGTALKNDRTGEIVYVPPQSSATILEKMSELEVFLNAPLRDDVDPLVAMALIHHQFESIHPFPEGNGRVGRILNVLYLCKSGLIDIPTLYLSRYITKNKNEYYRLLQNVRDTGDWESWLLYMLSAVSVTAKQTNALVLGIRDLMREYKAHLREHHAKIYSQELINNLFRHPYTRIEYVVDEVGVTRQTASRYLNALVGSGLLTKMKSGQSNYYINTPLVQLLAEN